MALSTKDVKTGEGGLPKTIKPGEVTAEILKVRLDQPAFLKKEDGYFIVLELMSPKPTDDFEGFLIDKDNPDGPRYEGPVGRVKSSRWSYRDGKTKGGVEISRDKEIMKFIKNLCEESGKKAMKWWNDSDEKYNTIEDFIEAFNNDAPFKGQQLNFCICGREYCNQEGFVNHDLYLPKFSKEGVPFEAISKAKKRLLSFNEEEHVEKAEPQEVEKFDNGQSVDETDSEDAGDNADFEL